MEYICLAEGVTKRKLVPADEDIYSLIDDRRDYYKSIFLYNENHYKQWKETGSVAGVTDVTTNRLVWDFDDKDKIEAAREDAKELCTRLIQHGVPESDLQIAFSGMKGYSVEVTIDRKLSPEEFKSINLAMAEGLSTNDTKILDTARIFRIVGTKHNKSGLYKFPLTLSQLAEVPSNEIMKLAEDLNNAESMEWNVVHLPTSIYAMSKTKATETTKNNTQVMVGNAADLDFKFKPKGFSNCKFAILNGFFPGGSRNNSLMALGATCRAQGYPKEIAYNMLKGAARLQGQRTNAEPYAKEEIWKNIVEVVYGQNWKGAQYSCKTQPWLKEICDSLGANKCSHTEVASTIYEVNEMSEQFEEYSVNIEKNTIKTGLKAIDDKVILTVGMPVGLLGAPSSGKTSLSLDILSNTSQNGIDSVFFSMDMYGPLVYLKQAMRVTGLSAKEVFHLFKHDARKKAEIKELIRQEYQNVRFSTKAGHTVQEMREIVNDYQEKTGRKVKLVLTDYLECISGPYSDPTANSSKIAGELRDFATEMAVCGITLVQPPKSAGDASSPLTSMRQVKGASMLEQSFRVILGIYRDGFGPNNPHDDKFITINALKNTMGELFSADHYWDGRRGRITEIDEDGELELAELRKRKAAQKQSDSDWG